MSNNKITFTNGSAIIPIKSNCEVIRGKRREVIEWYDDINLLSDCMIKEDLDKVLDEYVNKFFDNK